eukprot:scaffold3058_cov134-Isochrysis_galbana.AAC.6
MRRSQSNTPTKKRSRIEKTQLNMPAPGPMRLSATALRTELARGRTAHCCRRHRRAPSSQQLPSNGALLRSGCHLPAIACAGDARRRTWGRRGYQCRLGGMGCPELA